MKIRYIHESSWKGSLVVVRECSQCGKRVDVGHAKFCPHCGHKFNQRPTRIDNSKAAAMIEAYFAAQEGGAK